MNLLSDTNVHLENKKVSRIFFVFLLLMYSLVYMTKQCFAGALASIVDEGFLTLTEASIITASFYIVYTPLQVLGGVLADKYSPERLIVIGLLGSAVSNTVIFLNQNFWVMLIAWVFSAIIQFALWPSVFKILSSQLVRSDRPRMVFLISFASYIGMVLTFGTSAFIPKWQYNFAISAIVLVVLAAALLILCKKISPLLKKDRETEVVVAATKTSATDAWKIFLSSGFVMILASAPFRVMVENGGKTLSPIMLSQSYEAISPAIGNLLNVLIILAGMAGLIFFKGILSKFIKNEMTGLVLVFFLSLFPAVLLRFVGTVPPWTVVAALCLQSLFLSCSTLLSSMFNMRFTKYGLNGTAAGILNSMASLGIVLQYCILGPLAEHTGNWKSVTTAWIFMVLACILCTALGRKAASNFIQREQENK